MLLMLVLRSAPQIRSAPNIIRVETLTDFAMFGCERSIDWDWGRGGPVASDNFSVRWTGTFSFKEGKYTFVAVADDGIKVWVDGKPIINSKKKLKEYRETVRLRRGNHSIKVEYFERSGGALARLAWRLSR